MSKQRHRACVAGAVGILVDEFVQRGRGRQRIQAQHQRHQQPGQSRTARLAEKMFYTLHCVCKLAAGVPLANGFLNATEPTSETMTNRFIFLLERNDRPP